MTDSTSPTPMNHDQLHTVESAAAYFGCAPRLIYRLSSERRIRFTKAGKFLRFWQSDLDAYLQEHVVNPVDRRRS